VYAPASDRRQETDAMERPSAQPTFTDSLMSDLGGPRATAFFETCRTQIPWESLAQPLAVLFPKDAQPGRGGRPHWPVVMMLKITMLQRWFGLSDPMAEEMLKDRISFRRFVGLGWDEPTPDETTICVFRKRLLNHQLGRELFDRTLAILRQRGLVVQGGTLVDATLIEAPRGQEREDGSSTADPCATKTAKHNRAYFGYKAHIATDKRAIVTDYVYDTAKVSDHQHADQLMDNEPAGGDVYADSGYMSQQRTARLQGRGVGAHIAVHRTRGQKQLTPQQKAHNHAVAVVRAAVEHPFAAIKAVGGGYTRYRGMGRNALDFVLHLVAYNWRRTFSLACVLNANG
jgi:IS5 family transposase